MNQDKKKGDEVRVKDPDGGTTRAKIVKVNESTYEVKWLEARWNLNVNIMVARKGTKSTISKSQIV